MQDNLIEGSQKLTILWFQSQLFRSEINPIIMKMILVLECKFRQTTFSNSIISFVNDHQILFSKDALFELPQDKILQLL